MEVRIARRMGLDNYEPTESDLTAYHAALADIRKASLARKAREYAFERESFAPCTYRVGNGRRLRKALSR